MTLRRKLLVMFTITVFLSAGVVGWLVSALSRRALERGDEQLTSALVAQFHREFSRQGEEVLRRVESIAASDAVARMGVAMSRGSDAAAYFDLAKSTAASFQLDFLEFVDHNGVIISSSQWPAKFGYPDAAFARFATWSAQPAFLRQEELQDGTALGLFAVRSITQGEQPVYVLGGRRVDKDFLSTLDLPPGMRALLYHNRGPHVSQELLIDPHPSDSPGNGQSAEKLLPLIEAARQSNQEMTAIVHWSSDQADDELFHAFPLRDSDSNQKQLLGILLVGNSRRSYVQLERHIQATTILSGVGGILLAIILSTWTAARITRPVEQLVRAAQDVSQGNWETRVELSGTDEMIQLGDSFNRMTRALESQQERLLQAERVAAWRELARRLAHELKNPLFPLQLTVENLIRARKQGPEQFDEVFQESSASLLAEISNLKSIISRFSEFSSMPKPRLQAVQVNDVIQGVGLIFQAQLQAPGRPKIDLDLKVDQELKPIAADPELLHRAISNLVLNAIDAMPQGGTLTLQTRGDADKVHIEVADTGSGLTEEECERIFTPYYSNKQHGTGLGLAIVQSVISDHGGKISVRSQSGHGTTFLIELPRNAATLRGEPGTAAAIN